ncbi:DNA primase [Ahrensia sp. R2A130]|uniref:DNA primase n=1 Tax=Ahrensia sp. R2A130 TaxID=744979 RepID=UPI0001E08393|nr:DNA primase [Ahrensia sp. R2A130]EFL91047.1 DNA primase [Ahrensia sp. R2A130]
MRFTPAFLDEVRDRIPIADIIGRRVTFDRKKSNQAKGDFWACCPFHGEKSPSFHCENSKGRYHCFGCGVSGDHFRFLTELDGLSFPEAVERLADEAGVPMPAVDPQAAERAKEKATLHDVMQLAVDFFRQQLQEAGGAKARAYLRDRGLSTSVQNEFGLGYAPSSRSALKEYLASKDVPKDQIEACGLVVHGPDIPVSYDRFRDRIMFPILDARSRPIAFGGRALSADVPAKYLNSPETELFSKSNVLYNYAKARKAVPRDGNLLVCEGYMDVIALHAAGIENAVAPLGTALTEQQLGLAWKVGPKPVLCFDGDEAGIRAASRSMDLILPTLTDEKSAQFVNLPSGLDPDDYVKKRGAQSFKTLITHAMPSSDFLISRRLFNAPIGKPEEKLAIERAILADVYSIEDKGMQHHLRMYVRTHLANVFYNSDSKLPPAPSLVSEFQNQPATRDAIILGLAVHHPSVLYEFYESIGEIAMVDDRYQTFCHELLRLSDEFDDLDVAKIYKLLSEDFHDVLEEVHGKPFEVALTQHYTYSGMMGHNLKKRFPMWSPDMPLRLVHEVFQLLLDQYVIGRLELELKTYDSATDVALHLRKIEIFHQMKDDNAQKDLELDVEIRAFHGRQQFG